MMFLSSATKSKNQCSTNKIKKMENKVAETKQKETVGKHYTVDIQNIEPLNRAGGNIRKDYGESDGSLLELMKSILINGIVMPIRAYRNREIDGQWIAIDGHRRTHASKKLIALQGEELLNFCTTAGMKKEDAELIVQHGVQLKAKVILVNADTVTDEQLIVDMVTTNSGKALSPLELSEAVKRLLDLKGADDKPLYKIKDVASKFGMNIGAIKNLELLATAPKRIRDLIGANKVKYTVALEFIKQSPDFNTAIEKIEEALGVAQAKKGAVRTASNDGEQTEITDESFDNVRITRSELNKVNNKVDSMMELRKVFKKQIDFPGEIKDGSLHSFAKRLMENRLTASDIDKMLFHEQSQYTNNQN